MKLDGFGLAGYRSFGDEMVYINDLNKVNIFIGKNNSGKSNILRFCKHLAEIKAAGRYNGFDIELDYCVEKKNKEIIFSFQIKKDSKTSGKSYVKIERQIPFIMDVKCLKDSIWFYFSIRDKKIQPINDMLSSNIVKSLDSKEIIREIERKSGRSFGSPKEMANHITEKLYENISYYSFNVHSIDAFRQITKQDIQSDSINLNGPGLIQKLRRIQAPVRDKFIKDTEKFETINNFLRELIGEEDAFMQVPDDEDVINISIKNKMLPLNHLGTGIHELIILAASVTVEEDAVFCIEEPEIHIHPELQKKFIRYLQNKTNNQYLISTHSNACFDIPGINIYHCKLVNGYTSCELVETDLKKMSVLSDLGYKLSDLLQANYVIWVEGPSDRIYLNHWIRGIDNSLEEGIHYSIMHYGGRLLSHLAYDNPEVKEFIQLCKLNRNAAIIMDSDREKEGKQINTTKQRVRKNFEANHCFVWVTQGREIENYIGESILEESIREVHPKTANKKFRWGQYKELTKLQNKKSIDKIAVAKKVVEHNPDYTILDLRKQIKPLINCIQKANA